MTATSPAGSSSDEEPVLNLEGENSRASLSRENINCDKRTSEFNNNVEQDHQKRDEIAMAECPPRNHRQQDNTFSLKQFLQSDANPSAYQSTGARPKVYNSQSRPSASSSAKNNHDPTNKYPRNPTELPDFVQDHLVMEQCYLSANSENIEWGNLPDFALSSVEQCRHPNREKRHCSSIVADCSYDFTDFVTNRKTENSPTNPVSPMADIPANIVDGESADIPELLGFPLQVPGDAAGMGNNLYSPNHNPGEVVNNPKLLPDFLTDAPIRNTDAASMSRQDTANRYQRQIVAQNQVLRNEIMTLRQQIREQMSRITELEAELASRKHSDNSGNVNLEKAIEQVEDDLKRSTRRAISAESTVDSLKKEVDSLKVKNSILQLENKNLRAAVGNQCNGCRNVNPDYKMKRLAEDLKVAASSAEVSLRQLMSGVNNLRVLASTLDNNEKLEEKAKEFLPDFDEDNAAGPAL